MKFFFDYFDFTSSGAIAALVQGLLAKELWKRGIPRKLSGEGCTACTLRVAHAQPLQHAHSLYILWCACLRDLPSSLSCSSTRSLASKWSGTVDLHICCRMVVGYV